MDLFDLEQFLGNLAKNYPQIVGTTEIKVRAKKTTITYLEDGSRSEKTEEVDLPASVGVSQTGGRRCLLFTS